MLLLLLSYLGGALTILSPCILPVLPFVFARAEGASSRSRFLKDGLPLLAGMALTFAVVATLAAVGSQWVAQANQVGRWIALVVMAAFALALLWPRFAVWLAHPLERLGGRLSAAAEPAGGGGASGFATSLLIGIATGLLWAPCAGPILGLVLTGAALSGASVGTSVLLLAYAAGAATSLAIALLIGGRVFAALKRSLGAGEWLRRGIGVAMLLAVAAIASGLDTGLLTQWSSAGTARLEQSLLDRLQARDTSAESDLLLMSAQEATPAQPGTSPLDALAGATGWLGSPPLDTAALRGKVVLVDFWTYSCINCLRALPHVREWADKYRDAGLVVIGVHTPEFAFERDAGNVQSAIRRLGVDYPVAQDNDYAIWRGFSNRYWPAHYFIDAEGRLRAHHFGEGGYDDSERIIRQLLAEAGSKRLPPMSARVPAASGVEAASDAAAVDSPETYVGYARAQGFVGELARDRVHDYPPPPALALNQWSLSGAWQVGDEDAALARAGGKIAFRFRARDLHLVLAPGDDGKPVRFRVRIDGRAPGQDHGSDADADGAGVVDERRLYQLIRQHGGARERSFEIEFLDPGVRAYAFTFG